MHPDHPDNQRDLPAPQATDAADLVLAQNDRALAQSWTQIELSRQALAQLAALRARRDAQVSWGDRPRTTPHIPSPLWMGDERGY